MSDMLDHYRLCLPPQETSDCVDNARLLNRDCLELSEHRNCLVGIGCFYEQGVVLRRPRSVSKEGLCLTGEALHDLLDGWDDQHEGAIVPEPLRSRLVGVARRCGTKDQLVFCESVLNLRSATTQFTATATPPVLVYSSLALSKNLQEDMTEEEAWEYFEFNIVGSYNGLGTPLFLC